MLVSGIAGLVFLFWPDLKPEPTPPETIPPESAATLSDLRVRTNARYLEYVERSRLDPSDYPRTQLAEQGALVSFRASTVGYRGELLPLDWQLFDSSGNQVYEERARMVRPRRDKESATLYIWVFPQRTQGPFRIVIQLLRQDRQSYVELDSLESRPFELSSTASS